MILLSFVIPCYRSENTIEKVVDEIIRTVSEREKYDYEIIAVNDCSPDNVWNVISERAKTDDKVIGTGALPWTALPSPWCGLAFPTRWMRTTPLPWRFRPNLR